MEEIMVPMSQFLKETVEAGSSIPRGRVQQRTVEGATASEFRM